jgi:hypothetical protein
MQIMINNVIIWRRYDGKTDYAEAAALEEFQEPETAYTERRSAGRQDLADEGVWGHPL